MQSLWIATLAAGLSVGVPAPKDDPAPDAGDLTGTWQAVSIETNGQKIPLDNLNLSLRFTDGKMVMSPPMNGPAIEASFRLIPGTRGEIDVTPTSGPQKGQTSHALYQVRGDTLLLCTPEQPGAPRPQALAAEPKSQHVLMVLKRVKP